MTIVPRFLTGILCGLLLLGLLAGCGGGGGGAFPVVLTSIEVTPAQPSIALGTKVQFTATGIFSDHSKKDLTSSVTWSSSAPAKATVNPASGLATSVAIGQTDITAALAGVSGKTTLTVTNATLVSIGVSPTAASIARGTSQQFAAIGTFTDNTTQDLTTQVTWNSTVPAVAAISSTGLATSAATGSTGPTIISGSLSGIASNNVTLTVTPAILSSVEVTPTNPSIASGTTLQFKATGIFTDNTKQDLTTSAAWSSSTSAATITSGGLATGAGVGTPTITASFGGMSGTTKLTVTAAALAAIEIAPINPSIAQGTSQQFAAIGTFTNNTKQDLTTAVTWTSSNTAVATISNAAGSNGLATSRATGSTTIAAALGGISGQTLLTVTNAALLSIDVEPAAPTLPTGVVQQFTATGIFDNGTTQDLTTTVAWSSDTAAVTISNAPGSKGVVLTVSPGSANITASFVISGGTVTGSTQVTVISDPLLSIQVTPPNPSIPQGLTQQFTATGIYQNSPPVDLTAQATWSSSNKGVAIVSNDTGSAGLATPVNAGGPITITATFTGISGTANLTVTSATLTSIAVTPVNPSIAKGTTQQFAATGTYSDSSTRDITQFVTWTSATPSVAAISNAVNNEGLATGVGVGATTIRAALGSVVSNNATLTVTNAILQTITIAPATATIAVKTSLQFTATGHFSDLTTQDLTRLATWSSSNTAVAAISNAAKSKGVATGVSLSGSPITITARFSGISGTASLTVAPALLDSISIIPAPPAPPGPISVVVGTTQQFLAIGSYNGGAFTQDLTKAVVWGSGNNNIANPSNGFYSRGLAAAVGVGTTTITARKPSNTVPITPATITVTP